MDSMITVTGMVATTPRHTVSSTAEVTSFRFASFDSAGECNWYTVVLFDQLADNAAKSISKGDRLIVTGAVKFREWSTYDSSGAHAEIHVVAVGHDMNYGVSSLTRVRANTDDPRVNTVDLVSA